MPTLTHECSVCTSPAKVMQSRNGYRRLQCTACKCITYSFEGKPIAKAWWDAQERDRMLKTREALGLPPRKSRELLATDLPKRHMPDVKTTRTGHTVEEVPGGRVYRMKL